MYNIIFTLGLRSSDHSGEMKNKIPSTAPSSVAALKYYEKILIDIMSYFKPIIFYYKSLDRS